MRTHCRKAIKVAPTSPHPTLQTNIQKSSLNTGTSRTITRITNPLLRKNQVSLESISPKYRRQVNSYHHNFNQIFNNDTPPLVQAESSKESKIKKYRLVRILNRLPVDFAYKYRWRKKSWKSRRIVKNGLQEHSCKYKKRLPRFQIEFDTDIRYSKTRNRKKTLKTNKYRGKKPNFSLATNYVFANLSKTTKIKLLTGIKDSSVGLNSGFVNYKNKKDLDNNLPGKDFKLTRIKGKRFIKGSDINLIDINDIKQGSIGNCWLMATMIAIANKKPHAIARLIKQRNKKRGLYDVTIYIKKNGRNIPQVITVNDRFPVGDKPPRAHETGDKEGKKEELWVMLIEKAYAVYLGSYQELKGGHSYKAMEALTGNKASRHRINKIRNISRFIRNKLNSNTILIASSSKSKIRERSSEDGIADTEKFGSFNLLQTENHAYVIKRIESGKVKLYNPHGRNHPKLIPFKEFKNLFSRIQVGRL